MACAKFFTLSTSFRAVVRRSLATHNRLLHGACPSNREKENTDIAAKWEKTSFRNKVFPKPRYVDPTSDVGFKRIFRDDLLAIDFLNTILDLKGEHRIIQIFQQDHTHTAPLSTNRSVIFDFHCTTASGEVVVVECQRDSQAHFVSRTFLYMGHEWVSQGQIV